MVRISDFQSDDGGFKSPRGYKKLLNKRKEIMITGFIITVIIGVCKKVKRKKKPG